MSQCFLYFSTDSLAIEPESVLVRDDQESSSGRVKLRLWCDESRIGQLKDDLRGFLDIVEFLNEKISEGHTYASALEAWEGEKAA